MRISQIQLTIVLSLLLCLGLTACRGGDRSSQSLPAIANTNSPVQAFQSPVHGPVMIAENSSPIAPASKVDIVPFQLVKPLLAGSTEIEGSGPPNVPIEILDITFMGELVVTGSTDENGKFSLPVVPLEQGHRLGIALGNLAGTKYVEADFQNSGFNGVDAMVVPQVGFFYDSTIIVAP